MVCYVLRPFAAHPAILRVRAFTAWRKGVASLRAVGASLLGSPVAKRRLASADFCPEWSFRVWEIQILC
jgi:hypothetical protein